MLSKLAMLLVCCVFTFQLGANPRNFLNFNEIDLTQIPFYDKFQSSISIQDCRPFNDAPEFCPFFYYLTKNYDLEFAFETGTSQGETSKFFSKIFKKTHTVEINHTVFIDTKKILAPYKNIRMHYGDSPRVLKQLLPQLKNKRILFYLDAHWLEDWPLLEELEVISITHKDNCIVVIDDIEVPGRDDIPFDIYKDKSCSYEYIEPMLEQVFTDYTFFYLIPRNVLSRAKLIALPNNWSDESLLPKSVAQSKDRLTIKGLEQAE